MAFNLKALRQMQAKMQQAQKELEEETVTGVAGGGAVQVTCTGNQKLTAVTLAPEAIDPTDPEMLQDLILAAANDALERSRELQAHKLSGLAGLGAPGGLRGLRG
jgi:DNA-binding YbaB/EbfC family protein